MKGAAVGSLKKKRKEDAQTNFDRTNAIRFFSRRQIGHRLARLPNGKPLRRVIKRVNDMLRRYVKARLRIDGPISLVHHFPFCGRFPIPDRSRRHRLAPSALHAFAGPTRMIYGPGTCMQRATPADHGRSLSCH